MHITDDVHYIGVNDHQIDLFEGQYVVPNGMAYNSYAILDDKIAIMDTVDRKFTKEWLGNLATVLGARKPDYLIVQHMEPDHSAKIVEFMNAYPEATMTYTYYQNNVKPKPKTEGKKGWVCKVCGYVYEGDELPEDFVCPLCKHGAADFEPIE